MERRRFIVVCVCVCGHPALLNAAHWRYFSQDTSSVSVSYCCGIFCLSSTQKKKKLSLFIELTERRVGGQRYFIIALELEKSVTG